MDKSKYWSEKAKNLEPYIPGEQPKDKKYIKLNTNENPYPPSPKVLEVIFNNANESLRLYPDPECGELCQAIADYYNLNKNQIFPGNGSDEILAFSFMAFFNPGHPIIFPEITYSFYHVYCNMFDIDYKLIPLDDEYSIPVEEFFCKNGGIIFPNPNAPTGKVLSLQAVRDILIHNRNSVIIVDEAYIDFGGDSAVRLIDEFPNLLIIQTFSKSRSLAGLRLGYAMGNENLVEALNRVKNSINSYTIDRLAIKAGIEAIKDKNWFESTTGKIISTRDRVVLKLKDIGFEVIDSNANFIFITHNKCSAESLFKSLKQMGVLVRYFKKPRIDNYLRVSIGTDKEMDIFLDIISKVIKISVQNGN